MIDHQIDHSGSLFKHLTPQITITVPAYACRERLQSRAVESMRVRVRVSGSRGAGVDMHLNILGSTAYMLVLDIDYHH